jgi:hypothetical protein
MRSLLIFHPNAPLAISLAETQVKAIKAIAPRAFQTYHLKAFVPVGSNIPKTKISSTLSKNVMSVRFSVSSAFCSTKVLKPSKSMMCEWDSSGVLNVKVRMDKKKKEHDVSRRRE